MLVVCKILDVEACNNQMQGRNDNAELHIGYLEYANVVATSVRLLGKLVTVA